MNLSWYSLPAMVILFIFFLEIIITLRIYRKHRSHQKTRIRDNPSFLIVTSSHPPYQNSHSDQPVSDLTPQLTKLILTNPPTSSSRQQNYRLNSCVCLGSVFTLTFLLINYSIRPITYAWTLLLFPVLIPLPFLVIPALFDFRSYTTFSSLFGGLVLGAIAYLLLLG